jgi:PAS domain S-box-containing protein
MTQAQRHNTLRQLAALAPPFFILGVHHFLWHLSLPYQWFLFYPAVFVSSWLGGRTGSLISAILSIGLAYWFIESPQYTLIRPDLNFVFPSVVLLATSLLYSAFLVRLEKATGLSRSAILNEQRMRGELEQVANASLAISEEVARLSHADLNQVLRMVALQAKALTGARYSALGLATAHGEPLDPWVSIGRNHELADSFEERLRCLAPPQVTPSADGKPGASGIRRYPDAGSFPLIDPGLRSLMVVPVRYLDVTIGYLYVANKMGVAAFSAEDERLIEMLAARSGVAIETARLYRDEALQRTWLQTVIEQMPEGVILIDREGRVQSTNQVAMTFASRKANERDPYGNPMTFDVRREDGTSVSFSDLPLIRALTHGETVRAEELVLRDGNGRMVPILANAAPVRDANGEIAGAALIMQDITTIKELERLREEWTAIVAHDLRQPLSAISISAELLAARLEEKMGAEEQKILNRTQVAAAQMQRMIGDLQDASQIESRRLSMERQDFDLKSIITDVVEQYAQDLEKFSVSVVAPQSPQEAWIDPDRIGQILTNLLMNAVKYGRPGTEIRVEVCMHATELEVIVTNAGEGVPPDEMSQLFNRFFRTSAARATKPGLGLGLYISRGLAEAHGGRMWAESIPGMTTSFHFTVPRSRRAPVHTHVPQASPETKLHESAIEAP